MQLLGDCSHRFLTSYVVCVQMSSTELQSAETMGLDKVKTSNVKRLNVSLEPGERGGPLVVDERLGEASNREGDRACMLPVSGR